MNDVLNGLEQRINDYRPNNINMNSGSQYDEIRKLYMAEDYINYRYLYLARYIRENDKVLDIEGGYGTGVDLLSRYTAVDECLCLNTINYYTKIGAMYYQSDFVKFQTDCFERVDRKFNVVTFFDEKRTKFLDELSIVKLGDLLEYGGILAMAFEKGFTEKERLIKKLEQTGFKVEATLYQNLDMPELLETATENSSEIIYLRKNA